MNSYWLLAASAGATLLLAIAAFWAIWQTRGIQKSEKRQRLLNEIIQWAIDTINCGFEKHNIREDINLDIKRYKLSPDMKNLLEVADLGDMAIKFERLRVKSLYTRKIASNFGSDLQRAVGDLINNLVEHLKLFGKCQSAVQIPNDFTTAFEELGENKVVLDDCAEKVIEEATKIKTRDIGKKEENMSKENETKASKKTTLKDIQDHLYQQDKKLQGGTYFSGYMFGAMLVFISFGLLAGKYILTIELWFVTYCIVILIGGTTLMGFAWFKRRTLGK